MKILCVNQFYWPDVAATGQLLQDLCEDLTAHGHEVSVLAGRAGYDRANCLPKSETHNGVTIKRCGPMGSIRASLANRLSGYLGFYLAASRHLLLGPKPDLLFVESTPPLLVVVASCVAKLRRIPLVHVTQDLYPEIAESLGAIKKNGLLAGVLRGIHRFALRRVAAIVVLGRDMELVLREAYGCEGERLALIPNWADLLALTYEDSEVVQLKRDWFLEGKRIVMYSGNLGRAHLFEEILSLAEEWKNRHDVVFLCVGSGQGWESLSEDVSRRGLTNIVLRPYQERARLGVSLACGDVHLITQRPDTLGTIVPSKLYGVMGVARPCVFIGPAESEVAMTLNETGAGRVVLPGDVKGLAAALELYLSSAETCRRAGEAGRVYMQQEGDRPHRVAQYERLFKATLEKGTQ